MRNAVKLALLADDPFTEALAELAEARRAELAALCKLHRRVDVIRRTGDDFASSTAQEALDGIAEESAESTTRLAKVISVMEAAQLAQRSQRA